MRLAENNAKKIQSPLHGGGGTSHILFLGEREMNSSLFSLFFVLFFFKQLTLPQAFTFKASFILTYGLPSAVQITWPTNASLDKH